MKRKIKFVVQAGTWFDKVNGNTYHASRITRTSDGAMLHVPFQYGYGNMFHQTALEAMAKAKWLPKEYRGESVNGSGLYWGYERENNYPIEWICTPMLKRDVVELGRE